MSTDRGQRVDQKNGFICLIMVMELWSLKCLNHHGAEISVI